MSAVDLPNLAGLDEAEVAAERGRLDAGEPRCVTEIAGLQFYDYGTPGLDGEAVIPRDGDRLVLVRAPENRHDGNAVEVWWRNSARLGHLPRKVAAVVAGPLDEGVPLRAYVAKGGTGEAWSAEALLVGEPVRELHETRIRHAVERAVRDWEWEERPAEKARRDLGNGHGRAFHDERADRRQRRLLDAVHTLLAGQPFVIEIPPLGWADLDTIQYRLDVSRSTAVRIADRAGAKREIHRRGWYAVRTMVEITPALQDAMREWAAHPPRRYRTADMVLASGSHVGRLPYPDDIPF